MGKHFPGEPDQIHGEGAKDTYFEGLFKNESKVDKPHPCTQVIPTVPFPSTLHEYMLKHHQTCGRKSLTWKTEIITIQRGKKKKTWRKQALHRHNFKITNVNTFQIVKER